MRPTQKLHEAGQSIWLDNITRALLTSGTLKRYIDEFSVGAQQQLGPTVGVGARYIHRNWSDLVDDVLTVGASGNSLTFQNVENAERKYDGLELTFEKRFSHHWNLLANYTYSKVRGNHFGGSGDGNITSQLNNYSAQNCRTTADPTIGTNGTIPCASLDALLQGHPTWDLPHIVNVLGAYAFNLGPVNLTAGATGLYQSGVSFSKTRSMTVVGAANATRNYFYEGQGSDRGPAVYAANLSLEATYRLFGVDMGLKGECFNVTDRQGQLTISNTAWSNAQTAAGQTTRDAFGKSTARNAFQAPRSFRVTYLVRF